MGYRRLDINLLPPELQPGPVVRYAVIINTILIGATVAFLVVDSFFGLTVMASLQREIETKETMIQSMSGIEDDYNQLMRIEENVNSIGRLIALASSEYTDMPVIMDRITKLLPDGVLLESVTSQGNTPGSLSSEIRISLATSKGDPNLVIRAFNSFKLDPVLGNCYMRMAEFQERELSDLLETAGVTWTVGGPDIPSYSTADSYGFDIYATIEPPVDPGTLAAVSDKTEYFDVFALAGDEADKSNEDASGDRVSNEPKGVSAVEVY